MVLAHRKSRLTPVLEGLGSLHHVSQDLDRSSDPGRLASLDCFRGAVVASMVVVNNPGNPDYVYSQLAHVDWHGMTFADIIAPCFLWVIGVTTVISLSRRMGNMSGMALFGHVVRRALVLYVIGVLLTALPACVNESISAGFESLRVMGILQRIAICYVLGSAIFLLMADKARVVMAVLLLVGYWILLTWFPGPADGAGPFEAGSNRTYVVDLQLLGHLGDTHSHSLLTIPPALSTVLFGMVAGDFTRRRDKGFQTFWSLFAGGFVLCIVGILLSQWIPINRYLWTPSFALVTSGIAMVTFAAICWLVAVLRLRTGTGWLVAYGANPIFLFVLSELGRMSIQMKGITNSTGGWHSYWMVGYETLLSIANPKAASALFAMTYMALLGFIAVGMYRRGWIVKV